MTLDDRRFSRCLHLASIGTAVAALSMFLPPMGRLAGDDLTVGVSLSIAAAFVGLPMIIGLIAWSDRSAPKTPMMSAFLVLCGILAACAIAISLRAVVAGGSPAALAFSSGALGVSIALAIAAAFIRDRGHGAAVN